MYLKRPAPAVIPIEISENNGTDDMKKKKKRKPNPEETLRLSSVKYVIVLA